MVFRAAEYRVVLPSYMADYGIIPGKWRLWYYFYSVLLFLPIIGIRQIVPNLRILAMNKIVFSIILAIWVVWAVEIQAQTMIEATEVVRLHDEIGSNSPIPIVKYLDVERQGQLLAFGGDDHVVRLWSTKDQRFVSQLRGHREAVRGVTFSPDATRLATVAQDGQIHFWNVRDGRLLSTLNEPVRGTRRIAFQPDGALFAVCGFDKSVRLYDATTYKVAATLPAHDANNEAIAYSADGSLLAVGGRTGVVRIWRTTDGLYPSHLTDIEGDGRRVRAIAFSPDGSMLATGGEGPFIMLWNPKDGKLIRILAERPGKTFALVFCGNGLLASGESDNMVRLWNPATGQQVATLSGHTGTISTMAYESKSQRLVTGSFDASVRFWNLPTAEPSLSPVAPMLLSATRRLSETPASPVPVMPVMAKPAEPVASPFMETTPFEEKTVNSFPEMSFPATIITPETPIPQPQFGFPEEF